MLAASSKDPLVWSGLGRGGVKGVRVKRVGVSVRVRLRGKFELFLLS